MHCLPAYNYHSYCLLILLTNCCLTLAHDWHFHCLLFVCVCACMHAYVCVFVCVRDASNIFIYEFCADILYSLALRNKAD